MIVHQRLWSIDHLVSIKDEINLTPAWQRGAVWSPQKQVLLIDSVLRTMDLPKFYLLQCGEGAPFTYEAVDGQQRLRALFAFKAGTLALNATDALLDVDGEDINGKTIGDLSPALRDRFNAFEISVGEIEPADHDSVRRLFLRLQMGVLLNPAELRNAMPGPLRHMVDLIATTSSFFETSGIPDRRYKRQDYLAHVFTLLANGGPMTLKAQNLQAAYADMPVATIEEIAPRVAQVLDILEQVNALSPYRITQKWVFVDLCWLVAERLAAGQSISAARLAQSYTAFEQRRREFTSEPEALLGRRRTPYDRTLYNYLIAFKTSGAERGNVATRLSALETLMGETEAVN